MNTRTEIIDGKPVKITVCPPRVCAWGYSPHMPDHALGDTKAADDLDFAYGKLFKIKPEHRSRGISRGTSAMSSTARMAAIDIAAEFAAATDKPAWVSAKAAEMGKTVDAVKAMIKRGGGSIAGAGKHMVGVVLSDDQKAEIADLRRKGMSIENISDALKIGKRAVSDTVKELGMMKPPPTHSEDHIKLVASEWLAIPVRERTTMPKFAAERGVNYHALRSAARRMSDGV
jgi:hypothetical protein